MTRAEARAFFDRLPAQLPSIEATVRMASAGCLRRHIVDETGLEPDVVSHGLRILKEEKRVFYTCYPTGWHHVDNCRPGNPDRLHASPWRTR